MGRRGLARAMQGDFDVRVLLEVRLSLFVAVGVTPPLITAHTKGLLSSRVESPFIVCCKLMLSQRGALSWQLSQWHHNNRTPFPNVSKEGTTPAEHLPADAADIPRPQMSRASTRQSVGRSLIGRYDPPIFRYTPSGCATTIGKKEQVHDSRCAEVGAWVKVDAAGQVERNDAESSPPQLRQRNLSQRELHKRGTHYLREEFCVVLLVARHARIKDPR